MLSPMARNLALLKQLGWSILSGCLAAAAFLLFTPSILSEQIGVHWPSTGKVLFAASLLLIALGVSGRAGRLQYVNYILISLCFAAYVLGLRLVLNVAGVAGLE